MTEILRVEKLRKNFGQNEVLRGINLSVAKGETVCVLGASGSGKSTFLRCLNFMEMPTSGQITIEGKPVGRLVGGTSDVLNVEYSERELSPLRARIGMVFQQFNLFPHLTVEENIVLAPIRVLKKSRKEAAEIAAHQLERVGLIEKRSAYPEQLSGGQQQRVAIARALAMQPQIMLFDEATSSLDPELVGEVLQTMRSLAADGMTMIVVTHELGFAYNVANRVVFLHQGEIHEQGPAQEIMRHPTKQRTREFFTSVTQFQLPVEPRPDEEPG